MHGLKACANWGKQGKKYVLLLPQTSRKQHAQALARTAGRAVMLARARALAHGYIEHTQLVHARHGYLLAARETTSSRRESTYKGRKTLNAFAVIGCSHKAPT